MPRRERKMEISYEIHPYDHPERLVCVKEDGSAYLVELNYFGDGKHVCGCQWFEFHRWDDGQEIPECVHIKRVVSYVASKRNPT
jgi:hypothetical protein